MSKYYRIIGTEGLVSGKWAVYGSDRHGAFAIKVIDAVLYDEDRSWGSVLNAGDIEVGVHGNEITIDRVEPRKVDVVEDFRSQIIEVLDLVICSYNEGAGSIVEGEAQ